MHALIGDGEGPAGRKGIRGSLRVEAAADRERAEDRER
jgi:hypothetical protein